MSLIWGILIIVLVSIAWFGQIVSAISPKLAAKLGVCESESDVDKTFFIDQRAEAIWDSFTSWILLAAGILLIIDHQLWPYFGLIGGGIFLNFSGRGIITRIAFQSKGIVVGKKSNLVTAYTFLSIWLLISIVTIIWAVSVI